MSTTQIPPRDPSALPPKPAPRSTGAELYDPNHWEDAYRNSEVFNVPKLLLEAQDELSKSRRREAFWISVAAHILFFTLFYNADKFIRFFPSSHTLMKAPNWMQNQDATFIELPSDAQKVTKRPDTKMISDKDRVASHTQPIDPKELRKIIESARAGSRGQAAPPQQQQQQQAAAQNAPGLQQPSAPKDEHPFQPRQEIAELKPSIESPKVAFGGNVSAGTAVEQAARAAAANRGGYSGDSGDNGLSQGRQGGEASSVDILSDTMGVDFGPYLKRITHDIQRNWENLIPEIARAPLYKKGSLSIDFVILKDGKLSAMKLSATSADVSLDRAAWGGITNSNPFPPLPSDFQGPNLIIRCHFVYNPDGKDLVR